MALWRTPYTPEPWRRRGESQKNATAIWRRYSDALTTMVRPSFHLHQPTVAAANHHCCAAAVIRFGGRFVLYNVDGADDRGHPRAVPFHGRDAVLPNQLAAAAALPTAPTTVAIAAAIGHGLIAAGFPSWDAPVQHHRRAHPSTADAALPVADPILCPSPDGQGGVYDGNISGDHDCTIYHLGIVKVC